MKKLVSFLLALSMLAGICLMPVQATDTTSEVYTDHENMWMQSVTLRTQEGKEGIYYGATFNFDQNTIDSIKRYGLALSTTCLDTNAKWTDGINGKGEAKVLCSSYTGGLIADQENDVNSTSLVNIININNDTPTNKRNVESQVYVRPYIYDGKNYTFGAMVSCSMLDVLKEIDTKYYTGLGDDQLKGMLGMYERFSTLMDRLELPIIKAHYENGGYVNADRKYLLVKDPSTNDYESLLLEYRRDKVVASMKAQREILWSFDGDESVTYGRVAPSDGDADDSANGASYANTFYTLYPDRVYKGLPYTHGSCSLDVFSTMSGGKPNADGVYVLQGLNRSHLNSVTFDGSEGRLNSEGEAVGQFNVARLGSDCWDTISWAYESIGADVDADQTDQLTPYYGMYPIGEFDLSPFMDDNNTHGDTPRFKNVINGYISSGNTEELNKIYEAYALMQPGDTLVNDTHAFLCTGVQIAYNSDGSIDPEGSYISFLEQGSANEAAQSKLESEFVDDLSSHKPIDCKIKACKYCAGYDPETGVWDLSVQSAPWTFYKMLTVGRYIPMRPAILNDPTVMPLPVRLTDLGSTSDVTKIFDGALESNNRISQISLNIYQDGDLVNSTTAFGIQHDLTDPFALSRLVTDSHAGAYGSVLHGTPGLLRQCYDAQYALKLDAKGNPMTETVAAEGYLYKYTELKDADGNIVYQDGVTTADGKKVPIMVREKSKYGSDVYTIATEATVVPAYNTLVDNTYVVEADPEVLSPGDYYFEMTCYLGNGHSYTFRSGFFTVSQTLTEAGNYTVTAK